VSNLPWKTFRFLITHFLTALLMKRKGANLFSFFWIEQSTDLDSENCIRMEEGVVCVYTVPAPATATGNVWETITP
jgi:hypothetical protein